MEWTLVALEQHHNFLRFIDVPKDTEQDIELAVGAISREEQRSLVRMVGLPAVPISSIRPMRIADLSKSRWESLRWRRTSMSRRRAAGSVTEAFVTWQQDVRSSHRAQALRNSSQQVRVCLHSERANTHWMQLNRLLTITAP